MMTKYNDEELTGDTHVFPDGRVVKFKSGEAILKELHKNHMTKETLRPQNLALKKFKGDWCWDRADRLYREWLVSKGM